MISDRMMKVLMRATGDMGAPSTTLEKEIFEAVNKGWIEFWRRPQNSFTSYYKITDEGRKVLA